jgi:hypothetical protein
MIPQEARMHRATGPIAIGGIGGSGTRVVAQIVADLGFYMGATVNAALDNLWFTILIKRPRWFETFPTDAEIFKALSLFQRAMVHGLASGISAEESAYIRDLAEQIEDSGKPIGATREHAEQLIGSRKPDFEKYIGWGWKEPNTHVFLRQLCHTLDGLRYIHVMRHGLDMAFSTNHQQVLNWGRHYGLKSERIQSLDPPGMLDYWIAANATAIKTGLELLNGRFLLINYDALWNHPHDVLAKLAKFLAIDVPAEQMARLAAFPRRPASAGRFRAHGVRLFSEAQLAAVRRLGFEVV